ncbi:unnamed protein product, partial [Ixodes hexagonus]
QGILGSLFKPILDLGKSPSPFGPQENQDQGPQAPHLIHGSPIKDQRTINRFIKGLQNSGHDFQLPRTRNSFFGPFITTLRQFQICTTPTQGPGKCRYVKDCVLPAFLENLDIFLSYSCKVGGRHLGVCCPDEFFGGGSQRKPLFPILSGILGITQEPPPPPNRAPDYEDPYLQQSQGPPHGPHHHGPGPHGPHHQGPGPQGPYHPGPGPQGPHPHLQQPKPVQPPPVQPPPVQPPPVQPPPVQPPPVQPPPVKPPPVQQPPVQSPSASAPIQFPDDEEEAPVHQPPPSRQGPLPAKDPSKPPPPIPNGLAQLAT